MFKKTIIVVCILLWPFNLLITNSFGNFISFIIPAALVFISYVLYKKFPKYYLIPIVLIGIIQVKLLTFALFFITFVIFSEYKKKISPVIFTSMLISLIILIFSFSAYKEQTIFFKDSGAEQTIQSNIKLYPNIILAEIFQNKTTIYLDKISTNFFNLIDPSGYYFNVFPRQINTDVDKIIKFSFLSVLFLLFGILNFKKHPYKKFLLISLFAGFFSLTLLKDFSGTDFIIWVPTSIILIHGINVMSEKSPKLFYLFSLLFIIYSVPEYMRNFLDKK